MTRPFSHSRARNRGSGESSASSHQGNLLVDSSDETEDPFAPRSRSRGSRSKSRSRSVSPDSQRGTELLSMHGWHDSQGQRVPSPYPADDGPGDDSSIAGGEFDWRIGEGSSGGGLGSWFGNGRLGWFLWNTQKGWMFYVSMLLLLYGVTSLLLLVMNRFLLWTGVYKFGYPITTTFLELMFTEVFLCFSASLTRSFSRSLHACGLGCMVAPSPKPSKGKRRASSGGLRDFTRRIRQQTSGGVFEIRWQEAKIIIPLAVVYNLKIMLSNLSFAYTQLQIYQLSRVSSLLLGLVFTHFFYRAQSLSVTTLSSCITMVLSLVMASLRPGTRFAIEGFLAGLFSTAFVAGYPILLARTYKTFSQSISASGAVLYSELRMGGNANGEGGLLLSGDGKEEARAAWKMLHYTNVLAMFFSFLWMLISGELRDISRNCYILDVAFFWLMVIGAGAAAWATFVTGFLLVRATTPLTMQVVSYPRSALQTILLMGFKLPTWSWVGVLTCWGSTVWYLLGRRREIGVSFFSLEEEADSFGRPGRGRASSIVSN